MELEEVSVAMLYQDPHPAHRGFAEAIGADLVDYRRESPGPLNGGILADFINGLSLTDYDVYLVEGSQPLYTAIVHRATRNGKLVYLCADHGLYELGRHDFEGGTVIKSLIGRFGGRIVKGVGTWGIDGVVAVSEFAASFTRPIVGKSTPIEIAHPFIQQETYDSLETVNPTLEENVAVTVGANYPYKGVDLLVNSWPQVRESVPDAKLYVVGRGHPDSYEETPGVTVQGFVDNLGDVLETASLYVQPSRMDAFPVGVLEGMRAGLPPLVTETTGTRSEARKIDESLVVEASGDSLATGTIRYFERSVESRRKLSAKARKCGESFGPASRKQEFRTAFEQVLEEL